ncbi:hypothetical protein D0817_16950 [Flavobacterium cupreum]|uniref:Uncharacterized protein n=1 Tax=Flavobacterium cupreum TaxID=2133766 RepID=A0A434A4D8_9FLAO|nr:hypothetical protein [Flavobacterium cupreum]RUT69197.1 hypothetical protein D0817_16950 [Flavobacterium cupreum]
MKPNYYKYWETCVEFIEKGEIENAENFALNIASTLTVPKDLINKIITVNLKSYEKKIEEKMPDCIQRAKIENSDALCLYYSLDNGWDSIMYICKNYSKGTGDWISNDYTSIIDIGKARGFSGIFKKKAESAFFTDKISSGICILLMLRTTIAFYNVAKKFKDCGLKLCITATESDFVRVI